MAFHPLAGIRVVDLTASLAGPACTQLLAALGAEVTKVERPAGDEARAWGPSMFFAVNAGKRSVVLDLKVAQDKAELLCLTEDADVFVTTMWDPDGAGPAPRHPGRPRRDRRVARPERAARRRHRFDDRPPRRRRPCRTRNAHAAGSTGSSMSTRSPVVDPTILGGL